MTTQTNQKISKKEVIEAIIAELKKRVEHYSRLYENARQRSLESEGRNQTRYDTQKIETGYEADAYARKVVEARNQISRMLSLSKNANSKKIEIGALFLLEIKAGNKVSQKRFLVVESDGGILLDQLDITTISSGSPVADLLWGKNKGDKVSWKRNGKDFQYTILDIQ